MPRANDVLANERTYLAYIRTALAFIAFGFVVARFSLFAREFAALVALPGDAAPGLSTGSARQWRSSASSCRSWEHGATQSPSAD